MLKPCYPKNDIVLIDSISHDGSRALKFDSLPYDIVISRNITIENYFRYLDSIVSKFDSLTPYHLTEHLLVRANPWIIDSLKNTDYYKMMERDSFVYDQKKIIVLVKGTKLRIPKAELAEKILNAFNQTVIDVNIPEFKLRILQDSLVLYAFDVRVGKNEKKYLKMADRIVDLKTKTGKGTIVSHNRYPKYFNPVDGHEYFVTRRDDEKFTLLPQIPFLETEINGIKHGQLIHPTTNPATLGKAVSNGCIGTRESDAWVIYYYAQIGTKVNIRYDLEILAGDGKLVNLPDVYNFNFKQLK